MKWKAIDLPFVRTAEHYLEMAREQTAKEIRESRDRLIGDVVPETFEARGLPKTMMDQLKPEVGHIINLESVPTGFKRLWGWREGYRVLILKIFHDGFEGGMVKHSRQEAWRPNGH